MSNPENQPDTSTSPRIAPYLDKGESGTTPQSPHSFVDWIKTLSANEHTHEPSLGTAAAAIPTNEPWQVLKQIREQFISKYLLRAQEENVSLLGLRMAALERELQQLRSVLIESRSQPYVLPVTTMAPEPYELVRDIPVVIEQMGDDFTATFLDAGISASGDSVEEAIGNLKEIMVQKFKILGGMPTDKLGKAPKQQLASLRTVMRAK